MKKPEAEKLGMELLDKVGLADKADVKPVHSLRRTEAAGCHRQSTGDAAKSAPL